LRSGIGVINPHVESKLSSNRGRSLNAGLRFGQLAMLFFLFLLLPAWPQAMPTDLTSLSLEDLMNTKVSSVSKTEQKISRTASAIFVITGADIVRSGATNIPDLLRMVPGLDVAQINSNTWAISARGLNGRFSNKLLVMVDGRTVYTPTFGGVLWDTLDLPLENIERIEVIRGPGGTVWGANAVNGVINIITKKAAETRGGMLVAGGGNLDQGFGTAQYGGGLAKNTNYRVFTKYLNQDHLPAPAGAVGFDGWHLLRGGFRTDSHLSGKDNLTVEGDLYTGQENSPSTFLPSVTSPGLQNIDIEVPLSGGFLSSTWDHAVSARSDTKLQISFDRYKRRDILTEERNTFAIEFQHHFVWGNRQDVVWGGGYRYSDSNTRGNLTASFSPPDLGMQLFSTFFQDEVALVPNKLYVTLGTKLEHNLYTGFTWMPSARVSWTPTTRHMFWAATSRADRTPAESDASVRANVGGFPGAGGTPVLLAFVGNPRFKNEELMAYELGYRVAPSTHLSMDFATYYSDYDHQGTTEPAAPFFETTPSLPHFVLPFTFQNLMHGEAHGLEMAANWKVTDRWMLSPGYAFEQIHMHLDATSQDTSSVLHAEGSSPVHSGQLRSHLNLLHGIGWDVSAYFVERLKSGAIPSYTRLDTGLTWRWTEGLSMSVVGQNLVKDRHLEFVDSSGVVRSTLIKRSVYAKFTWQF
jgi:iron complex outermembrane receptor protein